MTSNERVKKDYKTYCISNIVSIYYSYNYIITSFRSGTEVLFSFPFLVLSSISKPDCDLVITHRLKSFALVP